MRLFFAVAPDPTVVAALAAVTVAVRRALGAADALRWTDPSRQHLTLHFLGEVDAARLPAIVDATAAAPLAEPAFVVELGRLGVFPPAGPVRAVWLGVGRGLAELTRVHAALGDRLRAAGLVLDPRPFSPHLTIARVGRGRAVPGLRRRLGTLAAPTPVSWQVSTVVLFESDLSGPQPRYTPRATIPLGKP